MPDPIDKIDVRPAGADDVSGLCGLLAILFAQEADFKPDAERQGRGLRLLLGQPDVGRVYCAMDGDTIVGTVSILYTVSTAEGGRAAWLEDMVVQPAWRGAGIGGRLLDAAIRGAWAAGCSRVTLLTDATNLSAIRFYGRAGFERSQMVALRLGL